MEEILHDLYRIGIPLPNNPLRELNSYVIRSPGRNLVIDTGMGLEECRQAMLSGLRDLGVDLKETDFFITHMHVDHLGLLPELYTDSSIAYISEADAGIHAGAIDWERIIGHGRAMGMSEADLAGFNEHNPGYLFSHKCKPEFTIIQENDIISAGRYRFKCVATPGHSKGHMCLYEPEKKIMVCGDHVLGEITPNIAGWSLDMNPLKDYLASLDKMYEYDIDLALPGHRGLIKDCKKRIRELKCHHRLRLREVSGILRDGEMNACQVASKMSWDMTYSTWADFPPMQKWFAVGEALSHIKYLEEDGEIAQREREGKVVFSLK